MHGRRNPFVAQEGLPLILLAAAAVVWLIRYGDPLHAIGPGILIVLLYLVFRDPHRLVPSVALGVFSPVDGEVESVEAIEAGETGGAAHRVVIRINSLGTYTARAPVEGTIKAYRNRTLWLQTDEGDDVALKFSGYRLGLPPHAFKRIGERLGQGQRCAYLRLVRKAEVQFPVNGKVLVEPGQVVVAGTDVLGHLPSPK